MKCPVCYHPDTKVLDSRVAGEGLSIRRRRECLKCGCRFSTYEEMEILDLLVVKRDERKEGYSREKLQKNCNFGKFANFAVFLLSDLFNF